MFTLQSRHRLDIRLRHFAYALLACAWAREPERLSSHLEAGWSPAGKGLACRSVRSGFHLLLDSLDLPAGTEVLVSAVTHPDMVRILEAHGLVAVPVDLDIPTLAPRLDLAERLVTPRTAAVLVAHLFGGRVAMDPLADFAKRHRLLLWEDCAQAFTGPHDAGEARVGKSDAGEARVGPSDAREVRVGPSDAGEARVGPSDAGDACAGKSDAGDACADVSMYSFGALKTCTALGGALLNVKDPQLLARMRAAQGGWRPQVRSAYAGSVLKFLVFTLVTRPAPYGLLAHVCHALGRDFDRLVNSSVRAFHPGPLLPQLEVRPSAPLLATLEYRLRTFDAERLRRRAAAGECLDAQLPDHIKPVGQRMESRTHWLFPVITRDPDRLILACRAAGVDGARAASSVTVVHAPPGRPEAEPAAARQMMSGLVFLPAYPELPRRSVARLVAAATGEAPELRAQHETWPSRAMPS
jgi:perosamine synthetase